MGHSDAHGDGAANGYHPGRDLHTKAQGIAAIVATDPFQCGTKYSKHNMDSQGERIHPVSVVCYYFLAGSAVLAGAAGVAGLAAGAAGVTGAVTAGLAAGAGAFEGFTKL